jgi:hypothetical protein
MENFVEVEVLINRYDKIPPIKYDPESPKNNFAFGKLKNKREMLNAKKAIPKKSNS